MNQQRFKICIFNILQSACTQARSQKFAMGGIIWGSGGKAPSRRRLGGLGAELPALENFAFFFCKNNLILGLFNKKYCFYFSL